MPLNERQRRFVEEYLIDLNGTQAAIRAGYSEKTARQMASENLTKPDIKEALRARTAELDARYEHRIMGRYEVLARLTEIARGDMGDLLGKDEQGNIVDDVDSLSLKRAKELDKSKLIKRIEATTVTTTGEGFETQTVTVKAELYSAHDALRDLGKHHALFTDKAELTGANGGPLTWKQFVEEARRDTDGRA